MNDLTASGQIVGFGPDPVMAQGIGVCRAAAVQCNSTMSTPNQIILVHPAAPPKPVPGRPCNGCGVCCLLAPCPLGMVLSGRRRGACVALRWYDDRHQYRCAALLAPRAVLRAALPRPWGWLARWLSPALARLAKRWIAVGAGCDSDVEPILPTGQSGTPGLSSTIQSGVPHGRS